VSETEPSRASRVGSSSEAERHLLIAARLLELRPWELGESEGAVARPTLIAHAARLAADGGSSAREEASDAQEPLEEAFDLLVAGGLVVLTGGVCLLSERGREAGSRALDAEADRRFDALLLACESSAAHGRFCRRVHGLDLCQLDVLDSKQLDHLVASLSPEEGSGEPGRPLRRLLDLGCGVGRLSEHLAAATGAQVLGIDRCAGAILRARERVRSSPVGQAPMSSRVEFREGDLRDLASLEAGSGAGWGAAVAVDSLYFVDDLDAAVGWISRLLAPGGRAAIFASELLPEEAGRPWHPDEDPEEIARRTRIAGSLERHGLPFRVHDFSGAEHALWRRQREAALALRAAFEAEGNHELWRLRLAEAERSLEWVEAGRVRRYFYLAEKAS